MTTLRLSILSEPVISEAEASNPLLYKKWERELKKYDKEAELRHKNQGIIYDTVLGQCTHQPCVTGWMVTLHLIR
jgi:hypothetical protein